MKRQQKLLRLYIFFKLVCSTRAIFHSLPALSKYQAINDDLDSASKRDDVRNFLSTLLNRAATASQICFITDSIYGSEIYHSSMAVALDGRSVYISGIIDQESFEQSEPTEKLVTMLSAMRKENCDYYIILITNGIQAVGFLRYADRMRLLNSRANFIMLHDYRLFARENHYIWRRMINVVFIRHYELERHKNWYELSTVPFPALIRHNIYVSRVLNYFVPPNRFLKKTELFNERKSENLEGSTLSVVVYPHSPAVVKNFKDNVSEVNYSGLEVSLLEAIARKMNFRLAYFEVENNEVEKWGELMSDGNYSGLLGVMNDARADIAVADLYQTAYHLEIMDLTVPYATECLTFITPEVLTDNSWQALTSPFSLGMWIGALLSLVCMIVVFYAFSNFYIFVKNESYLERRDQSPRDERHMEKSILKKDIFDSFSACAIYAYSMILLVAIPKLPDRWSVRLLTGWWWIYCLLLVVAYRASLTSILANPQPRLTIDTLEMLAASRLACGMWGEQNRNFFLMSPDPVAEKIGSKLEEIDVPEDGIAKVERGEFAYFESSIELRRLRFEYEKKQIKLKQNLHIMEECAVNMPISIGLDKNSPLKDKFDELIRYALEGGLVKKWFSDAIKGFESSVESMPAEAIMDLKKFYAALIALLIGYVVSLLAFASEMCYWIYFVKRHPRYDKYFGRIITDCQLESHKIASRRRRRRRTRDILNGRQVGTLPLSFNRSISQPLGQ